jgi:hypothetical protein
MPLLLSLPACGDMSLDEQQTLQKAHDYLADRKVNAAAIELRNTLKADPDNAEARYLLAGIKKGRLGCRTDTPWHCALPAWPGSIPGLAGY